MSEEQRAAAGPEERAGVELTHLDAPLFDGAGVTKRDLVDYLDAVSGPLVRVLSDRPLSVIRARPGQKPFMQKNVPKTAPAWMQTVTVWAAASKRDVTYALCDDRRTLLWFANQRAVEFHPTLGRASSWGDADVLILDLDPPETPDVAAGFSVAMQAAHLVRTALDEAGLQAAVKTSGAKGLHVVVPLAPGTALDTAAYATRALAARAERLDPELATTAFLREERGGKVFLDATRAGGATVVAAYSPRARPGLPVSFPVPWSDLDGVAPGDFTVSTVPDRVGGSDPWAELLPPPQALPEDLVEEGRAIPAARVQAMHEGKRRRRAARAQEG